MIKVSATSGQRSEIIEMANIFRSKVVDMSPASITIEATGSEGKLRALLDLVRPFGIVELVRSGRIAIARSSKNEVSKA
jgi:acetolactate synthase-1/3 small subunit